MAGDNSILGLGALGDTLGGMILPGLGGIIGSAWTKYSEGPGGSVSQMLSQNYDAAKKFSELSGYNAAGYKGTAVKSDYANALSGLQNSAAAINAANAQNQMAGRMLTSQQQSMDSTNRNAQNLAGAQTRSLVDLGRNQTLGGGGLAALADSVGKNTDNTILSANNQNAQNSANIAAQAAGLNANSSNILNSDLANRYNLFVKPHEYQENNLAQAALGQFGPMVTQNNQDRVVQQPLSGLGHAMGALGGGMMGSMFGNAGEASNRNNVPWWSNGFSQ